MEHGFKSGESDIKWGHIVCFKNFEKKPAHTNGSESHRKPYISKAIASMRVNVAAQVLSHSVAAKISTSTSLGEIFKKANNTVEFVNMFDKLFNTFNSCSVKSCFDYYLLVERYGAHGCA